MLGDLPMVQPYGIPAYTLTPYVIRSNHPITTLRYRLCPWHLPNSFYFQIVPDRRAYLRVCT